MNMNTLRTPPLRYALAAGISLLTFTVYLSTLGNGFINWDDDIYIYNNAQLRTLDVPFFQWAFTNLISGSWMPVTWISYGIDHALWGLNPAGFHLTNSLIHAANTFIAVCLSILLLEVRSGTASASLPSFPRDQWAVLVAGGVTGALFGLHSLRVESVAWIAERKDVLCTFFFLLSIMAHIRYALFLEREGGAGARTSFLNTRYLLTLSLFALALASKPMAITLPLVLLLLDWYPLYRIRSLQNLGIAVIEKLPFLCAGLVVSWVTLYAQKTAGYLPLMNRVPLGDRMLVAVKALMMYLWKMAVPLNLSPLYPYPEVRSLFSAEYLSAIALTIGITAGCAVAVRKQPFWLSLWGYYVITLLPVLGLVQAGQQSMADRYTYLPSLGPFLAAGSIAGWGWRKAGSLGKLGPIIKSAMTAVALAAALILVSLTLNQIAFWKDTLALWNRAVAVEPHSLALFLRGSAFRDQGLAAAAIEDYTTVIAMDPNHAEPYLNRSLEFAKTGQYDRAIEDLNVTLKLEPDNALAYMNRGVVFDRVGRYATAVEDLHKAVMLDPSNPLMYTNRGAILERGGHLDQALSDYNKAIELDPSFAPAYGNRGIVFSRLGRYEEAFGDYAKAISLNPDQPKAYMDRGALYRKLGKAALAALDFQKVCDLGSEEGCGAGHTVRSR